MSTDLQGTLVALGTPTGTSQPRALIHCTEDQIRRAERVPILQAVTVVASGDLAALRELESKVQAAARSGLLPDGDRINAPTLRWLGSLCPPDATKPGAKTVAPATDPRNALR